MAELILKLKDREVKRIAINKAEITIGRDMDADLCIDNPGISRIHATVSFRDGYFSLLDHGSSNGTYINGERVEESTLNDGDQIQIGKYHVIFSMMGQVPSLSMPSIKSAVTPDGEKKKVRDVFGTVQFTADEIQKLVKAQPDSQSQDNLPKINAPKASSPAGGGLEQRNKMLTGMLVFLVIVVLGLVGVIILRG